uniref:Glyco_hydro_25 n=1 Tax=uncultured Lactobacillus sp. TaxID=153152 RepID=A0A060C1T1_9LACO|nr:Glyco_hydro_25 [uncultured Lactobacillus sp.]
MTLKFVDVSSAQGNYTVGSNGEEGIIVKVSEGTGYVNPNFEHVASQAKASGKPLGIYHWLSPGISGASQADYFIANSGEFFEIANPILDCEQKGITVAQVNDFVTY